VILRHAGGYVGEKVGKRFGNSNLGKELGTQLGSFAGSAVPYLKHGGYIKGKRNHSTVAILHGGETVLPATVKPTKKQKKAIKKLHKRFL
jgi:hypothetical protein